MGVGLNDDDDDGGGGGVFVAELSCCRAASPARACV